MPIESVGHKRKSLMKPGKNIKNENKKRAEAITNPFTITADQR